MGTHALSELYEKFVDDCRDALAIEGTSGELGVNGQLHIFLEKSFGLISAQALTLTQQPSTSFGVPDFRVSQGDALLGHIEFKGVKDKDIGRLTSTHDKKQKELFTSGLHNLIYTNGWQWELWQDSERKKRVVFDSELFAGETRPLVEPQKLHDLADLFERYLAFALTPYSSVPTAVGALARRAKALKLSLLELEEKRASAHLVQLMTDFRDLLYRNGQPFEWENFVDSYVQIAAFGALLWRIEKNEEISLEKAVGLEPGVHPLLHQCLHILWDRQAQDESTQGLLEELARTINLIPPELFVAQPNSTATKSRRYVPDPIVHAYEPFFKEYDAASREENGVFYTPVELVQHIVSGVDELLKSGLDREDGILDEHARFLDPATGTGTFLLGLANEVAHEAGKKGWPTDSIISEVLTERTSAFELFPGPYTIAHQRLETLLGSLNAPPRERLPIYLTDTLSRPETQDMILRSGFGPAGEQIVSERKSADRVKTQDEILVILGNPPYERIKKSEGGWDHFTQTLMDQVKDATPLDKRQDMKSATDLFVAFWAWSLWALQESESRQKHDPLIDTTNSHGLVAFVTNRTWIIGPSLVGLRNLVLRGVKEVWVYDLGGDNRGASKEFAQERDENVFGIQTGVAIVWLVFQRDWEGSPTVRYKRRFGKKRDKLEELTTPFTRDDFELVASSTTLVPSVWPESLADAPELPDLFLETYTGIQSARDKSPHSPWGIQPVDVYAEVEQTDKRHDPRRGTIANWAKLDNSKKYAAWATSQERRTNKTMPPASSLTPSKMRRALYRPLDERYVYDDPSWITWFREELHEIYELGQVPTLVSLTRDFGKGPLALYTELLPEQHSFRGSTGGRAVYTLYKPGVEGREIALSEQTMQWAATMFTGEREQVAEKAFSYILAVISAPAYAETFWVNLQGANPRVPLSQNAAAAQRGTDLGDKLRKAWTKKVEVEGIRWSSAGQQAALGKATWSSGTIKFKGGRWISGVPEEAWNFSVSGFKVLHEWFRARQNWKHLGQNQIKEAQQTIAAARDLAGLRNELDELFHSLVDVNDLPEAIDPKRNR